MLTFFLEGRSLATPHQVPSPIWPILPLEVPTFLRKQLKCCLCVFQIMVPMEPAYLPPLKHHLGRASIAPCFFLCRQKKDKEIGGRRHLFPRMTPPGDVFSGKHLAHWQRWLWARPDLPSIDANPELSKRLKLQWVPLSTREKGVCVCVCVVYVRPLFSPPACQHLLQKRCPF